MMIHSQGGSTRASRCVSLMALVLLPLCAGARSEEAPIRFPMRAVGATKSFQVGLDWLTPAVVVGEPLQLRLRFNYPRADSNNVFQTSWDLSQDLVILVAYPGHGEIRLRGVSDILIPLGGAYQMHPGETQTLEKSVLFLPESFSGLVFERPGTHTVRVLVRCGPQGKEPEILVFGPFQIRVDAPDADDAKAVEYLEGLDVDLARLTMRHLEGGRANRETQAAIEGLASAAPRSRLAPYAFLALASWAARNDRHERVLALVREIYTRFPAHMLADDALYLAYDTYLKMGREEYAVETYRRLFLNYPDSHLFRSHDKKYLELIAPAMRPAEPFVWTLFDPAAAPTREEWAAMQTAAAVAETDEADYSPPDPGPVERTEFVTLPDTQAP